MNFHILSSDYSLGVVTFLVELKVCKFHYFRIHHISNFLWILKRSNHKGCLSVLWMIFNIKKGNFFQNQIRELKWKKPFYLLKRNRRSWIDWLAIKSLMWSTSDFDSSLSDILSFWKLIRNSNRAQRGLKRGRLSSNLSHTILIISS